jgi:pimeloyl-ACP methyl ester carboxylesterase
MEAKTAWEPPSLIGRDEVLKLDHEVAARHSISIRIYEDVFRIQALEMEWDIGAVVYEPQNVSDLPTGPDGNKVGVFLLHGGVSDYKSVDRVARALAEKFGVKVASMTFPGRFYLLDPSRDWPGEVEKPDGTARTPLWTTKTQITKDQYEIVHDTSKRESYGTLVSLSAKPGTEFYERMAAWPVAFEAALKETARRHLPEDHFSIYIHGHSTGGPFAMMASQRIPNISGILGYGTSPFGYMYTEITRDRWPFPFHWLRLRTWRDTARYLYEGMKDKGVGLPMLMELTLERWETGKKRPNFKAEDFVHKNSTASLEAAARVSAVRLKMSVRATDALVEKYLGYTRELSGPGVKPVPPFLSLHGVKDDTVTLGRCERSLSLFGRLNPPPKVRCVSLGAGVHTWSYNEPELPQGVAPAVAKLWHDSIMNGFYRV